MYLFYLSETTKPIINSLNLPSMHSNKISRKIVQSLFQLFIPNEINQVKYIVQCANDFKFPTL